MKILSDKYFKKYSVKLKGLEKKIEKFKNTSKELDFWYLTEASSVFSSNIEWNSLDLNSFMNNKNTKNKSKEIKEIENLIKAYKFAQNNKLNESNFLETHKILSKTLLISSKRWIYRDDKVWVFWSKWLIYLAMESEYVNEKMKELFEDISKLLKSKLSNEEVFYYSSLIHLKFVHIHPFADWNGRSARILEKWFLTEKLWTDFWKISSEEFYWKNRDKYYNNINLWVNYYELDYNNCNDFLIMLVESLDYFNN